MNLSKIMGSMTLRERRMLNEAVKQRIVEDDGAAATPKTADVAASTAPEAPAAPAAKAAPTPAPEPSDASPIGSTLSKGGKVVFELTKEGWKTTLRISEDQILALVNPINQDSVKKNIRSVVGQGAELYIPKMLLDTQYQGAVNEPDSLFLKRDGKMFADPVAIPLVKMQKIKEAQDLKYTEGSNDVAAVAAAAGAAAATYYVDNATITVADDGVKISIPVTDDLSVLDALFGISNNKKIGHAIAKASRGRPLTFFKIPISWAMDGSIMKYMSDSILRGVGIGKIEFEYYNSTSYRASIKLNPKEVKALKEKLDARATANASAS